MTAPFNTVYADGGPPVTGDGLNTFLQTCPSVAAARGFIGTQGMAMLLQGFVTPGDEGVGLFYWNASGAAVDDGGITTIVPTGSAPGSGEWTRFGPGLLFGTPTNDNAPPGFVGEYISASLASGSAVALTTNTPSNIVSITLSPGDWDCWVDGYFTGGNTTTVESLLASISTVSATLNQNNSNFTEWCQASPTTIFAGGIFSIDVGPIRLSLSSPTPIYFVAQANFGTSTCSAYGIIQARRRR